MSGGWRTGKGWAAALLALFVLSGRPALGQEGAREAAADARAVGATVFVNEVPVLTLRTAAGGLSAERRAEAVAANLMAFQPGETVRVSSQPPVRLLLGSRPVLTLTAAEAQSHGQPVGNLAAAWARELNRALLLPPLAFDSERLALPPTGSGRVGLTGRLARRATVAVRPEGVVRLARVAGGLQVQAQTLGTAVVTATGGGRSLELNIRVVPPAAAFPQNVTADVTGVVADADLVEQAVIAALRTQVTSAPGSTVAYDKIERRALRPGEQAVLQVPVRISAPDRFPAAGTVNVLVRNIGGGRRFEDLLWYSNEPENIRWSGQLYWGRLLANTPTRLLWHHFNRGQQPLVIQYVLANNGDLPARVSVVSGDANPGPDPTLVGYLAGQEFFLNWLQRTGMVVTVPPRSVAPLVLRRMAAGQTVSGLATLHLLEGGSDNVVMVANAVWPNEVPARWRSGTERVGSEGARPWTRLGPVLVSDFDLPLGGQPKHVYDRPSREVAFQYRVGGPLAFLRIGEVSIGAVNGDRGLSGNFGVHYILAGRLENPTERRATVEAVFEASAGYAGAVFLVNGQFVDGRVLPTKRVIPIFEATLEPGAARDLRIETLPLSGAHYPVTITIRPKDRT